MYFYYTKHKESRAYKEQAETQQRILHIIIYKAQRKKMKICSKHAFTRKAHTEMSSTLFFERNYQTNKNLTYEYGI